jgi:hypothetical protein
MPVVVTVTVPVDAVALAAKVSVLVPVAGLGLKDAVTPLGKPDAERVTLPLKPSCGVMVMALVPWPPCAMDTLPGAAESVKPGPPCALPDEPPPQPISNIARQTTETNSNPSFSRSIRPLPFPGMWLTLACVLHPTVIQKSYVSPFPLMQLGCS